MGIKWWRILHWLIIVNFLLGILYGFYMVFFVVGGGNWPLFGDAVDLPTEQIFKRRLYAVETWVAITGLCIYLGVTEILPRKMKGGP